MECKTTRERTLRIAILLLNPFCLFLKFPKTDIYFCTRTYKYIFCKVYKFSLHKIYAQHLKLPISKVTFKQRLLNFLFFSTIMLLYLLSPPISSTHMHLNSLSIMLTPFVAKTISSSDYTNIINYT